MKSPQTTILQANCTETLASLDQTVDFTFLDPPFNQNKDYAHHDDQMAEVDYWSWMTTICRLIYARTSDGGALYFMQREKNTEFVLRCLRESGWSFQNLIIWKKKTSAVPGMYRYGKHYQVIGFATRGNRPRVFNRLRIDPPLLETEKYRRPNGMYVTDVWDDIRELTAGYFAGDEALRDASGDRLHKQQAPLALLVRMLLSSTQIGDRVLDPFAGTGTTLIAARQLQRHSTGIEIDPDNVRTIEQRLADQRQADNIEKYYADYTCTDDLATIWGKPAPDEQPSNHAFNLPLFQSSGSE